MGVNFGQVGFLTGSSENNFKKTIDEFLMITLNLKRDPL
ncbi:MAG: hypothetical protein Ct9H90mP6_11440 [Gammaproteobacteria bacterium]|nr:MAG: hypothetical protein Ct9H90mP6_11440 [Gammaproteobacteria bacterium]